MIRWHASRINAFNVCSMFPVLLSSQEFFSRSLQKEPHAKVAKDAKQHNANLESAHRRSANHREEVLGSELCGCFYCRQTFPPSEIEEWTDELAGVSTTALCPRCGIDSVIGSCSGFALTPEFLREMHDYWFT